VIAIEIPDAPHSVQRVTLGEQDFTLTLEWIQRESFWYLSLADANEVPILTGRKVVANFPLLARVTDARAPAGELIAVDVSGANADPGRTDLGTRVLLTFWPRT
jgi:hypothetical protein